MDTGQSKNRLLIVDGDPKSLRVLEVSLKKAGFRVTTASNGSQALEVMAGTTPDLIISDTDLDGTDGFELCRQIKSKPEWAKIPFLFVSGRKSIDDKIRGLELGVDDYLTKPVYIKEIGIRVRTALQRAERERLESRRDTRTKFSGDLADIGVVDLVQTIDLNRKSGIIHIVDGEGRRGAVFFRDGRVIDAEVGRLAGPEAMYRLFSWSDGRFEVEFKPIRRRDVIELPTAALLMEGMRRLDEWTRLLETLPGLDKVVEVDYRVLADQLAELPDEVNGLLRLCDGSRSLQAVIDDSDFPDLEALTVASNLFNQHILYVREPGGHREAEPSGELARWLEEGASLPGDTTERFPPKAWPSTTLLGVGSTTASSLGEMTAEDKVRTFTGDLAPPQVTTPMPRTKSEAAAPVAVPPGKTNTLRMNAPATPSPSEPSQKAEHAAVAPPPPGGENAQPEEVPETPVTPAHDADSQHPLMSEVTPRRSGALSDTLRGIPIPKEPEDLGPVTDKPKEDIPSADVVSVYPSSAERSRITAIEYGSGQPKGDEASDLKSDAQQETDWGGWAQGTEAPRETTSDPLSTAPVEDANDAATAVLATTAPKLPWEEDGVPTRPRIRETYVLPRRLRPARHRRLTPIVFSLSLLVAAALLVREIRKGGSETTAPPENAPLAKEPTPAVDAGISPSSGSMATTLPDASPAGELRVDAKGPGRTKATAQSRKHGDASVPVESTGPTDPIERCRKLGASARSKPISILTACQAANQADPNATDVLVLLAQVELDRGNVPEARSWAKKAIELRPELADAYVFLGGAEQEAGNADEAKTAYKKYLELAPNGRYARELRAVLDSM
jgi:CheY-like chemotaxis protein